MPLWWHHHGLLPIRLHHHWLLPNRRPIIELPRAHRHTGDPSVILALRNRSVVSLAEFIEVLLFLLLHQLALVVVFPLFDLVLLLQVDVLQLNLLIVVHRLWIEFEGLRSLKSNGFARLPDSSCDILLNRLLIALSVLELRLLINFSA